MKVTRKIYLFILAFSTLFFVIGAFNILKIVIHVELGKLTMTNSVRETIYMSLVFLFFAFIPFFLRPKAKTLQEQENDL